MLKLQIPDIFKMLKIFLTFILSKSERKMRRLVRRNKLLNRIFVRNSPTLLGLKLKIANFQIEIPYF